MPALAAPQSPSVVMTPVTGDADGVAEAANEAPTEAADEAAGEAAGDGSAPHTPYADWQPTPQCCAVMPQ